LWTETVGGKGNVESHSVVGKPGKGKRKVPIKPQSRHTALFVL